MSRAITKTPGCFPASGIGRESGQFFADNGYIVVVDGVAPGEVDQLRHEAAAICRGQRGRLVQQGQAMDLAALAGLSDDQVISHFLCIHQPHKASRVIHGSLSHPTIVKVLTGVIGPNVKCMQSMLFIKAAGKPGQAWHQDEDYIPTRDRSLTGAWIALDDATIDNGCLWVIPGSHKPGILWPQYPHKDKRYDCSAMSYDFPYGDADAIPVEVPAGAIVFFNGYLLHKSEPNRRTTGFRRALVNHYMSAESFLPWHVEKDVPVAKMDYRDVVMIAGKDPYAWKGYADIARPHVRPAGEGGCGDGRVELETFRQQPAEIRARQ